MKRAAIAVLLLSWACQRAAPPPGKTRVVVTTSNLPSDERRVREKDLIRPAGAKFLDSAKIGAQLGSDGRVADEVHAFTEGQPVYFTMNFRESPVGLQTRVVWFDDDHGKELAHEQRPMNGAKTVTFSMTRKLAPGFYRVDGFWGGNFASEKVFQVVKR